MSLFVLILLDKELAKHIIFVKISPPKKFISFVATPLETRNRYQYVAVDI